MTATRAMIGISLKMLNLKKRIESLYEAGVKMEFIRFFESQKENWRDKSYQIVRLPAKIEFLLRICKSCKKRIRMGKGEKGKFTVEALRGRF